MEHLANILTNFILKYNLIDKKNIEIYNYGFQCFLEMSLSALSCIVISSFLHMIPECLFFFFFFIPLRSYGGGVHMDTYLGCFIGSCIILTSSLLAVKYLDFPFAISFLIYVIATILLLIIGPVDHPNRKVATEENLIFKKKELLSVLLSFICAILFFFSDNSRYMFLQAIVFLFVFITSFIGQIKYRSS